MLSGKSTGMSGDWLGHIAPRGAMFEHAVEYNQQFAHGRDQRHLFRLASCQQPLVEVPDSRVVAAGYQRSHVEDGPHPGASAPDGAFAPPGATVPVVGGHAHKGRRSAGDSACPALADWTAE